MQIHKEGRSFLLGLLVVILLTIVILNFFKVTEPVFYSCCVLLAGVFIFCLQFFRNPSLTIDKNPAYVLAPADGKIVVIEETLENEYLKDKRIQISIFMSPVDKHVNRNPVGGVISYLKYHPGRFLVAWNPKASTDNERTTIVYKLSGGVEILLRQIAGALARRIRYYISEEDKVEQGAEFGFIKFGSRVDVFLPLSAEILVSLSDKTEGGKTVLARLE